MIHRFRKPLSAWCMTVAWLVANLVPAARAEVVTMRSGMRFEGATTEISSIAENPLKPKTEAGALAVKQIVLIDDQLRRVFVPQRQIAAVGPSETASLERIKLDMRVLEQGRRLAFIGDTIRATPFDDWGRRILTLSGGKDGRIDLIQGITEITPVYTKLEGLQAAGNYVSDMRVRTSTIPREVLSRVLMRHIDPKDVDQRLRIVRLYSQAERFKDARDELERIIRDFPELKELERQVTALNQLSARRFIREIEERSEAGQHALARHLLTNFPSEGVAAETLLRVRDLIAQYEKRDAQIERARTLLTTHLAAIEDEALRKEATPAVEEIQSELNLMNLDRMADYLRLSDDAASSPSQLLSLAISGWYLGSGAGIENLAVSATFREVRDLVRTYLTSSRQDERQAALERLATLEGGIPKYVAGIVAAMKPLEGTLPEPTEGVPGYYELRRPGMPGDEDFRYLVQLPPEYSPYRRYPCVVSLHGAGMDPGRQIEWWAGGYNARLETRLGQATRHGFIVIAPAWTKPHQTSYEYSLREHAAVLYSLRDACRRFSIDTDRVFLSGHGMGGDAAWDIALAHPDAWAGVICIGATADKYVTRYWENAARVPFYFVFGELDGTRLLDSAGDLDRYMTRSSGGFDVTVVEYRGRGPDHFIDEIQEIFQWMTLPGRRRDFLPKEFTAVTMRPWDNFFWWVELDNLPPRAMVTPLNWPDSKARPAVVEAKTYPNNRVVVKSAASTTTVWLAPGLVDFDRGLTVEIDGRKVRDEIVPSVETILEDVRTRGDRQHPFWAKARP